MNNKSKLSRFLSKDITLMVISVLLALVIWFVINAGSDAEGSVPINDIPITLDLSSEAKKDGLHVYYDGELTASVDVEGNKLTVGSLSASDIEIVPLDINNIEAPGYYELKLKANKKGVRTNYSLSNPVPSTIEIFVDRHKKRTINIDYAIDYTLHDNYYIDTSHFVKSVTIEGPETIVNSIDKAEVRGSLDTKVNKETSGNFDIVFLDKNGKNVDTHYAKPSITSVVTTVKPIPIKTVNLDVKLINAPKGFDDYVIQPSSIQIAVEQEILDGKKSAKNDAEQELIDGIKNGVINVGTLDFSTLDNKNHNLHDFDVPALPEGCKNIDKITDTTVTVDLSDYSITTVYISEFKSKNINTKEYDVNFNTFGFEINVCGPKDLISDITDKEITATVDFAEIMNNASGDSFSRKEVPIVFSFSDKFKGSWVFGKYTVDVDVRKR